MCVGRQGLALSYCFVVTVTLKTQIAKSSCSGNERSVCTCELGGKTLGAGFYPYRTINS
jgi:hypothetical protein